MKAADHKNSLCYFRAIQGHSGGFPIVPELMGYTSIPCDWKEYIFHRGCSWGMQSILVNGLIRGGKENDKTPQAVLRGRWGFTARELQSRTFQGPGASKNTTKNPREDPQRKTRRAKMEREREKKSTKFWASHPLGPTFGAPPFGAPTLPTPPFWAPPFWAPLFLGSGPHPSGPPTPSGPHPSGPTTSGSFFFWVWHHTLSGPTMTHTRYQKWIGKNWIGQNWIVQNWIVQNWIGQKWIGQNWIGQNWIGQNWLWPKLAGPKTRWPKMDWPKNGLAKNGQIRMAKNGLAKVGLSRVNRVWEAIIPVCCHEFLGSRAHRSRALQQFSSSGLEKVSILRPAFFR